MEKELKLSAKTKSKVVNESVYGKLVGLLIYLTATRPDLHYVVSYISWFMIDPKNKTLDNNLEGAMLCEVNTSYVKGTLNFGILYSKSKELQWCGYSN